MKNNIYTVFDCSIIHLSRIYNRAGNITPVTNDVSIPFAVKRIYYLYDMPGGESRGSHAHRSLEQLVVAASGSFDITVDDGINKKNHQPVTPLYGTSSATRNVARSGKFFFRRNLPGACIS